MEKVDWGKAIDFLKKSEIYLFFTLVLFTLLIVKVTLDATNLLEIKSNSAEQRLTVLQQEFDAAKDKLMNDKNEYTRIHSDHLKLVSKRSKEESRQGYYESLDQEIRSSAKKYVGDVKVMFDSLFLPPDIPSNFHKYKKFVGGPVAIDLDEFYQKSIQENDIDAAIRFILRRPGLTDDLVGLSYPDRIRQTALSDLYGNAGVLGGYEVYANASNPSEHLDRFQHILIASLNIRSVLTTIDTTISARKRDLQVLAKGGIDLELDALVAREDTARKTSEASEKALAEVGQRLEGAKKEVDLEKEEIHKREDKFLSSYSIFNLEFPAIVIIVFLPVFSLLMSLALHLFYKNKSRSIFGEHEKYRRQLAMLVPLVMALIFMDDVVFVVLCFSIFDRVSLSYVDASLQLLKSTEMKFINLFLTILQLMTAIGSYRKANRAYPKNRVWFGQPSKPVLPPAAAPPKQLPLADADGAVPKKQSKRK